MKENKVVQLIFAIAALIIGGNIIFYYWSHSTLSSMQMVPMYLMILAFVYILLQIGKRYVFKRQKWWDWLYYIGLTGMMLPVFFASGSNVNTFNTIADYGTLFLVIPVLLDVTHIFSKNK